MILGGCCYSAMTLALEQRDRELHGERFCTPEPDWEVISERKTAFMRR